MRHRKSWRRFLALFMTVVLCLASGFSAFAKESAGVAGTEDAVVSETEEGTDTAEPGTEDPAKQDSAPAESMGESASATEGESASLEESGESVSSSAQEGSTEETPDAETSDTETAPEEPSEDGSATMDVIIAQLLEQIRSEFGEETAQVFEEILNNANVKALLTALDTKLKAEFGGLTEEELEAKLESMTEEELAALMEKLFDDPEIARLMEQVANDEELADSLEALFEKLFGDLIDDDTDSEDVLKKPVSGNQGEQIRWTLDTDGTLTITGKGPIVPSYEEFMGEKIPVFGWDDYADYIKKIVIRNGVTEIPDYAFFACFELRTVILPASITSIGEAAFAECENLTAVYFQGNAPKIAKDAFEDCADDLTLYYLKGTTGWDQLKGYRLAVWQTSGSGTQTVAYPNTVSAGESPDTGDTTAAVPYVILLVIALAGGITVISRMRRKEK